MLAKIDCILGGIVEKPKRNEIFWEPEIYLASVSALATTSVMSPTM
jgi:hypothetical protein